MKYKLTAETRMWGGHELHRIEATESFANVKAGELGGWIESEKNLGQEGDAWVYDNAEVFGNARVYNNARVYDNAWVYGDARVYNNAEVYDNAEVYGNAEVYDNAWVCGNAEVYGDAWVYDNARVTFWYKEDFKLGSTDHTVFKNCWSSYRDFFYNAQTRLWSVGCFLGTSEELCRKAYADGVKSGDGYSKYIKFAEMFLDGDPVDVEKIKKEVLENEANEDA